MSVPPTSPSTVTRYFPPRISGSSVTSTLHPSPSMPPFPVMMRFSASTSPRTLAVTPAYTVTPATGIVSVAESSVFVLAAHVTASVLNSRVHPKNSSVTVCSSSPMLTRMSRAASVNTVSAADSNHPFRSLSGPITAWYMRVSCSATKVRASMSASEIAVMTLLTASMTFLSGSITGSRSSSRRFHRSS